MKKIKLISLFLCLMLVLQCVAFPASATLDLLETVPQSSETTASTDAAGDTIPSPTQAAIPFGSVCIEQGCRTIEGKVPLAGSGKILDSALSAFVFETTTQTVIYGYNPDMHVAPGNLAKIVTALIALEMCELDEIVTCSSRNISKLPSGSLNVKLREGEQLSVKDLVYCMLLQGANDAAIALAEHISGNQDGFVMLMNNRVREMGCRDTEFGNVHGLDTVSQHTTARDMAKITMAAVENETFKEIFKAVEYTVPQTNESDERSFYTNNYLMDQHNIQQFYDKRVTGGIVHYASTSGASLACTAEYNNLNVVCIVMCATRIHDEEETWRATVYGNFNETLDLLNFTFDGYKVGNVLYDGQALEQFAVSDGESSAVGQPRVNLSSVLPKDAQMDNLTNYYSVTDGGLFAPIEKDELISTVQVWYRNSCLLEAELFAMAPVKSVSESSITIHGTESGDGSGFGGVLSVIGTICVIVLGLAAGYLIINNFLRSRRRAQMRRRRKNRRRSR